jgi:cation:H+ antiporter
MLYAILAIIIGIGALIKSADLFVEGASGTAKYFGMSEFLIGMLILGFGTSAPELLVSASASLNGNGALALGNAYGSNIANIALILGVTTIISPVIVQHKIIKGEMLRLFAVTLLSFVLLWNYSISRIDASILLTIFFAVIIYSFKTGQKKPDEKEKTDDEKTIVIWREIIKLLIGLAILVASSKLLVWGAVEIAKILNVSDLVIGLTIVAIGTSLPELASSVTAAIKGNNDMAIGNVVGSNMFNTLAVVGLAGSIKEINAEPAILYRDISVVLILTLLLIIFSYTAKKSDKLQGNGLLCRWEGIVFTGCYVGYTAYLITSVQITGQ